MSVGVRECGGDGVSATTELVGVLEAASAVTALVGARIYPMTLPQGVTLPAIRYRVIDDVPVLSQSGNSNLSQPRVQLTCCATTYAGAEAVARALRATLHGKTILGQAAWVAVDQDDFDPVTEQYLRYVDVLFWRADAD